MGIRSFESYSKEYKGLYSSIFELAKMEDKFVDEEATCKEAKKYNELKEGILSQCPIGTDIEDLIGLVVVGEKRRGGRKKRRI